MGWARAKTEGGLCLAVVAREAIGHGGFELEMKSGSREPDWHRRGVSPNTRAETWWGPAMLATVRAGYIGRGGEGGGNPASWDRLVCGAGRLAGDAHSSRLSKQVAMAVEGVLPEEVAACGRQQRRKPGDKTLRSLMPVFLNPGPLMGLGICLKRTEGHRAGPAGNAWVARWGSDLGSWTWIMQEDSRVGVLLETCPVEIVRPW
ncbi:uncharacterized protein B0I36DRAFT_351177 [Microdochium trichocladiopsis]|uniref:Uncharacterized protein n=1 Tax=Microdochium trichocladiopsis TaxID=1682393 RepID=A0A9P8Y499_9PEZI|nr:uncharacterized protein B0I36DRAFT_351177 [Microdochium trichocladiopsis]KAH7027672.1 hypothetical protein B0I36DRAFT_351177 [Microdochium trichocladiopsis]